MNTPYTENRTADKMHQIAEEYRKGELIKPYLDDIEEAAKKGKCCITFDFLANHQRGVILEELKKLGYKVTRVEWVEEYIAEVSW